jgi:hypothetical protein
LWGNTYNQTGLLDLLRKLSILRQETITWMDHVDAMVERNLDNLIASKVGADWGILATLADNVGLVGFLPMHAKSVLITENCNRLQGEFVCLERVRLARVEYERYRPQRGIDLQCGKSGESSLVSKAGIVCQRLWKHTRIAMRCQHWSSVAHESEGPLTNFTTVSNCMQRV